MLHVGDSLNLVSPREGRVATMRVTGVHPEGNVIGRLEFLNEASTPVAVGLLRAADDAAEAFSFSLMELEEANLAAEGLRFELPDGQVWRLGVEARGLLVTEHCSHIAFKPLMGSATARAT